MHARVKPLLIFVVVLLLNFTMTLAQEETPPVSEQAEQTATAQTEANTSTPSPAEPTEEATEAALEVTEDATAEPTAGDVTDDTGSEDPLRGLPLLVLLTGAVAVLIIGTFVLVRENPRPLEDEE